MKYFLNLLVAFVLAISPQTLSAQNKVGGGIVGGKEIEIFSDFTWSYKTAQVGECKVLHKALSFCGASSTWQKTDSPAKFILAQFRYDDRLYGQFIVENLGKKNGLTIDMARKATLSQAKQKSESEPLIITVETAKVSQIEASTTVYRLKVFGTSVVFANAIAVTDTNTFQIITYEITDEFTPRHSKLHAEFLELTQIREQE